MYLAQHALDYDIVHLHSSRDIRLYDDLCATLGAKKKTGKPLIISIHRADLDKTITTNHLIQKLFIRKLKKVDKIIFLSQKTREQFVIHGIDVAKTEVLYNFHKYSCEPESHTNNDGKFHVLFVGFLSREKGIFELLEAMRELPPNVILDVCGAEKGGEIIDFSSLCCGIEDRIVFHGYVSGKEKDDIFRMSDVFCLPSYGEGMPLVLLEAYHFGLPVVITNVGAIPEVMQDGENGYLIRPKNTDDIINAIRRLYDAKVLLKEIRTNNAKLSKKFTVDEYVHSLCSMYWDLTQVTTITEKRK